MNVPPPRNERGRRAWWMCAFALAFPVSLAAVATPAWADGPAVPALSMQLVRPGAGAADGWLGRSVQGLGPGQLNLFGAVHYARAPLRFSAQGLHQAVLGDVALAEVGALVGLPAGWQIGMVIPAAIALRGGGPNLVQLQAWPQAPALGDVRLDVRKVWWSGAAGGGTARLASAATWELPTSDPRHWLGGSEAVHIQFIGSGERAGWRWRAGAGYRWTATQTLSLHPVLSDGSLDHTKAIVALRAGSTVDLWAGGDHSFALDRLAAGVEARATIPALDTVPDGLSVVDLAANVEWRFVPWLRGALAVGGSPTSKAGSASMRVLAAVRIVPAERETDSDGDGIADAADRCPTKAEDKDGFEDGDGCPDPDDDGDGIADASDRCRLRPEDRDGFEDDDGCPDLDDDNDGVADRVDLCPRKPEDKDGHDDDDGCPDPDDDGDGIADVDDLCPQQPETRNGHEDKDGCPDLRPGEAPPPLDGPGAATPVDAPADPTPPATPPPEPQAGKRKGGKAPPKALPAPAAAPAADGKPRAKVKPIAE